jgi:hypothetical protein
MSRSRSKTGSSNQPVLEQLQLDWDDETPIPIETERMLKAADQVLQQYWDQWLKRPIEQYVACDFRDVWRAIRKITIEKLATGNTFCEWGCGFGIVTGLASQLGWEAIGIEAEPTRTAWRDLAWEFSAPRK